MKTVICVIARMGSSRLPGKVLRPIIGRPMLELQVERLRRVRLADDIVIATTIKPQDDEICSWAETNDVGCFRGSEDDVIERFLGAAEAAEADIAVRVTGDCPLIDPATVDAVIRKTIDGNFGYVVTDGPAPTHPNGMGCEGFTLAALKRLYEVSRGHDPETAWGLIRAPETGIQWHELEGLSPSLGHHRWTVDTTEDFTLVEKIFERLYPENAAFGIQDIASLFIADPALADINRHVKQKTGPHASKQNAVASSEKQ